MCIIYIMHIRQRKILLYLNIAYFLQFFLSILTPLVVLVQQDY